MCVERVHRVIMALIIFASVGLLHSGYFFESSIILTIVGIALLVWAFFDFCLMVTILRKFLPNCWTKKVL